MQVDQRLAHMNQKVRQISDEALFDGLDLTLPGLEPVREAAERRDYPAACAAWAEYLRSREDTVLPTIEGLDAICSELGLSRTELKSFLGAARWLEERLRSQGFTHGNGQCEGAGTLVQIALLFPEFTEAQRWLDLGLGVLAEHARRGLYPDGCPRERSIGCAALSYRLFRDCLALLESAAGKSRARRLAGPEKEVAAIRSGTVRMLDFLLAVTLPGGQYPAFNGENRGNGGLSLLADGGLRFSQGEYLWPLAYLDRPLPEGAPAPQPLAYTSVNLPDSRFAAMRSDWTPRAHCMIVNYGPYGGDHSHKDMLSFEAFAYGQAMAIGSGMGATSTTRAHNMLVVEEGDIDRQAADGERPIWATGLFLDGLGAQHRGYEGQFGLTIRRNILFVKPVGDLPGYWLIHDLAAGGAPGRRLSWYLHSPLPMAQNGDMVAASLPGKPGLQVIPTTRPAGFRLGRGLAAVQGLGLEGDAHQEIDWLALDGEMPAGRPYEIAVLLAPYEKVAPAPGAIRVQPWGEATDGLQVARCCRVMHPLGYDVLVIGDGGTHTYPELELTTDARFALIRVRGGLVVASQAARGTTLNFRGEELAR